MTINSASIWNLIPNIAGTLGLDIIAVSPDLPHGDYGLDNGRYLQKFLITAQMEGFEDAIDLAIEKILFKSFPVIIKPLISSRPKSALTDLT